MKTLFGLLMGVFIAFTARADDPDPAPAPPGLASIAWQGAHFFVRTVDLKKDDLRLFLRDDQGKLLHEFPTLEKYVAGKGERLVFAANAGMFQPDSTPVGLLIENGQEIAPLNLNDGTGNFFMKPNGVFLINDKHEAHVIDSANYAALLSPPVWATQSGPLLVHGGDLNPEFIAGSANKKIRSGVGVRKDGTVVFALSAERVTFYQFASFFLSEEKCPDALYLDGEISSFWASSVTSGPAFTYGPMFGLVVKE